MATDDEVSATGTTGALLAAMVGDSRPEAPLIAGSMVGGQYRVERMLGRGGMGVVFLARDLRLDREIAIKVGHAVSPSALARIEREAMALAKLSHPNVVAVHQVGEVGGRLYLAMEYVAGGSARDWLTAAPRSWREIVAMFAAAARGLAAAHAAGFVHRDVKPDNLLVGGDGRPRVADFGVVRDTSGERADTVDGGGPSGDDDTRVTAAGTIVGTPAYMAPEQLAGGTVGPAADQFALAVACWEALHGTRPFRAVARGDLRALAEEIEAGRLTRGSKRVPRRIEAVLRRALAADPARRWPSIAAMADALERRARPRRRVAAIGAAVVLAGAIGAIAVWQPWRRAAPPPLHLGSPQVIARADPGDARVLLRDGRIVHAAGATLEIADARGEVLGTLHAPEGGPVVALAASRVDGWLLVTVRDRGGCATWHLAVDGGEPEVVDADADCASRIAIAGDGKTLARARPGEVMLQNAGGVPRWTIATAGGAPPTPDWSPDGARLAIGDGDDTVVVSATDGAAIARAAGGRGAVWLDDRHLVHARALGFGRGELRMLDVATGDDRPLHADLGALSAPSIGGGVVLAAADPVSGRAIAFTPGADPVDLDAATPLATGAERDIETVGWTDDGRVVTLSQRGSDALVIGTAPGGAATTIATHPGAIARGALAGAQLLYQLRPQRGQCELRVVELEHDSEQMIRKTSCQEPPRIVCAAAAPRCIELDKGAARWIRPDDGHLSDDAPAADDAAISADGTTVATGADVHATPPLPAPWRLAGDTLDGAFLVIADDGHLLARVERDGRWRALARSAAHTIAFPVASASGAIALVLETHASAWSTFRIDQ